MDKELKSHDLAREMEISKLQEENEILKDNAEHNAKAVDKINWENMLLKKENQELKSQLRGTTHCFDEEEHKRLEEENKKLKKQLEEWKHHLKCSKEMLDIQGQKGNYDYDEYMLGLYNGMEYIISLFEKREPNYISGKDVEFTNNKTQQKEFIDWLECEVNNYKCKNPLIVENFCTQYDIREIETNMLIKVLNKYKEIIGDKK